MSEIDDRVVPDATVARGKVTNSATAVAEPQVEQVAPPVEVVADPDAIVTIKATELKSILDRLDIVEKASSSSALDQARAASKVPEKPLAYLKVFMNKIVIGWKTERAELYYNPVNPNMVSGEILKSTYFFLDGSDSGVMDQVLFTRCEDRVNVRILSDDGKTVKVKFERLITANEDLQNSFKLPTQLLEIRKDFLNP